MFDALQKFFDEKIADSASNIANEVIESICSAISQLIISILKGLNETFNVFEPNKNLFNTYMGDTGPTILDGIINACQIVGAFIVVLCIILYIFKCIYNPNNLSQTPMQVILRSFVAVALILGAHGTIDLICETMTNVYKLIKDKTLEGMDFSKLIYFDPDSHSIVGVDIPCLEFTPFASGAIVLALIVCWPLIKNFFRFLLEMLEHYIVFVFTLCFLPAFAGTMITKETENIFKAWINALMSNFFLLMICYPLFLGAEYIVCNSGQSITSYLFALGYLHIIQKIDYMLKAMGLNIAQTTGRIFDSIVGAARGISMINRNRESAGNTLKAVGAATGMKGLHDFGATMGTSARSIAQNGMPTSASLDKSYTKARAQMGLATNNADQISHSGKLVKDCLTNPHTNMSVRGALGQDVLNKGISENLKGQGLSNINDAKWTGESLSFKATGTDGLERDYELSKKDTGLNAALYDGDNATGLYLNSKSTMSNGDTLTGDVENLAQEIGAMGLIDNENFKDLASASYENGEYTLKNDGDVNIGVIDKNGHLLNNHSLNTGMEAELDDDFNALYGDDYKMLSGFSKHDGQFTAQVQMRGSDTVNTVYADDYVSRNCFVPNNVNHKKARLHRGNDGNYRTLFAIDNEPAHIEKK